MDTSYIYRLKDVCKDARLFYSEKGNPYETVEKYVLYWRKQLCIEIYTSEHSFDYYTSQKFILYNESDSDKLLNQFGGVEELYDLIVKQGVDGGDFILACRNLGITPLETLDNPFVEDIQIDKKPE